jgi:hypothetical protein
MRRIYCLIPNTVIARAIVDELLLERVEERHIHIVAKPGTPLGNLPEASVLESSDFYPALEQGIALGGVTGLLAGLVAVAIPTGLVLGGGAVLAITLAGAGVGGLMSSMVGISADSRRIEDYQAAIDRGELLLMIDVPRERVEEIESIVMKHHPEVELEGVDPHVFP